MKTKLIVFYYVFIAFWGVIAFSSGKIFIYMDEKQRDHLRAYGVVYFALERGVKVEWLLNYRGGSFLLNDVNLIRDRASSKGVSFEVLDESLVKTIYSQIDNMNADIVVLEKATRLAVYASPYSEPWDDAVRMVLEYADIPHDILWDKEVLRGDLSNYDWLHLHHEDFTGQFGKFYGAFRNSAWYNEQVKENNYMATILGFKNVPSLKKAVAKKIREYVEKGGFLFAMCSATETLDIALASLGVDIVDVPFDGTPPDSNFQSKLNFNNTFAFKDFKLNTDPNIYEHSDIDISPPQAKLAPNSLQPLSSPFSLFEFSAKYDSVLAMLVQNHEHVIKDFLGQTSNFKRDLIKEDVVILGDVEDSERVKYIHGNVGKGCFSFLAGHDPEDYAHIVGEEPTNVSLHKNSPGYRLILNNVLFPAAKEKERKT